MNVYVASAFRCKQEVKRIIATLQGQGHQITFDWTDDEYPEGASDHVKEQHDYNSAENDMKGVAAAEVVILLHRTGGQGCHMEVGAAVAFGKQVIVIRDSITRASPVVFHSLCHVVSSVEEAVKLVGVLQKTKMAKRIKGWWL